ncbi:hypothetical protein EH196_19250 [Bacillus sp. C1-1]|nr:hypothetical protein EH196_19250 [Bacillus sp. C1-1]
MNSKFFNVVNDQYAYEEEIKCFDLESSTKIPVYLNNRDDLLESIDNADRIYDDLKMPEKFDIGLDLSSHKEVGFMKGIKNLLAFNWYNVNEVKDVELKNKTVLIMGLYKDITHKQINDLIFSAFSRNIQISVLTGRDISSLSWFCAKQFLKEKDTYQNGLFTFRKINKINQEKMIESSENLSIHDKNSIKSKDIQKEILDNDWGKIIFHGHGKEDNINLEEYTICGMNGSVSSISTKLPRCGYCNQTCFKDDTKLIPINRVNATNVIMTSCSNGPFSDLSMYDEKFNLLLNAIDGPAKLISACLTVQDADLIELNKLIEFNNEKWRPTSIINHSLNHPFPSMLEFGASLPIKLESIDKILPSKRLLNTFDRANKYLTGDFLEKNHPLKKMLPNLISKGNLYMMRGQYGFTEEEKKEIESKWEQKIRPINEVITNHIIENPECSIMNFDSYTMNRSMVDQSKVRQLTCSCGNEGLHYFYEGFTSNVFNLEMKFCYKCGDKSIGMVGGPDIIVNYNDHIKLGQTIKANCVIQPAEEGEIHFGWFVPGYIYEHLVSVPQIKRFKNIGTDEITYEFVIEFDDKIPAQGYYFTVFTVQNLGLTVNREFFTIERDIK